MTGRRTVIPPGSTIGILGGGQLGKMTAMAAARLGYHTVVWAPPGDIPAMEVATYRIANAYEDLTALEEFARTADVCTTEFENVPVKTLAALELLERRVRPSSTILDVAQRRSEEKRFADRLGVNPVTWAYISGLDTLLSPVAYKDLLPGILKTDRLGYDGKGQYDIETYDQLLSALKKENAPCVLEKRMSLDYECSILVARNAAGHVSVSDVVKNEHRNGILWKTNWSPGLIPRDMFTRAEKVAVEIAVRLDLVGILAIEFFVSGGRLYLNEMAPRPHNSFHGSIEAAHCSQFEQHVRAICNLPLGEVRFHTPFIMENLLRGEGDEWLRHLDDPSTRVHNYGKQPVVGKVRKMGHVTRLSFR